MVVKAKGGFCVGKGNAIMGVNAISVGQRKKGYGLSYPFHAKSFTLALPRTAL